MDSVDEAFPAPSWREYPEAEGTQREYTIALARAIREHDYVALDAPTGAGKSIMLYTALQANGLASYYVTPLNTLLDQVDEDEYMKGVMTIKGKNNYECIHELTEGDPVDEAECHRDGTFTCPVIGDCEYYRKKDASAFHPTVATNVSMLMSQACLPPDMQWMESRPVLVVDECQKVEDFAVGFSTVNLAVMDHDPDVDDATEGAEYIRDELLPEVMQKIGFLSGKGRLDRDEVQTLNWLKRFKQRLDFSMRRIMRNADNWVLDDGPKRTELKPLSVSGIMHRLLWSWGGTVVVSSATMPDGLFSDIGIPPSQVERIEVPSTFPVENRPVVVGRDVGKMTEDDRDKTIPKMADAIADIAGEHAGDKGIVHCRSYEIMQSLVDECPLPSKDVVVQDRDDREGSLESWRAGDSQVFFSVSMDEGIDLEYDQCRFQVLAKALYKHMGDTRVRRRVFGDDAWPWYQRQAAIQIQQAYGRGVRARDDECTFYVLDTSAVELIERNEHMFEGWFLDAVVQQV